MSNLLPFAVIGVEALGLLYLWLLSSALAQYISERKGYGPRPGLASGLLLTVLGVVIWLIIPAKADSRWKLQGIVGSGGKTVAEARAELRESGELE